MKLFVKDNLTVLIDENITLFSSIIKTNLGGSLLYSPGFFNCKKTRLNEEQTLLSKGYKQEGAATSYYDILLRAKWFLVVDENDPVTNWWDCQVLLKTDDRVLLIKFSKPTGKEVVLWCKEENFLFTQKGLKVNFCLIP